MRLLHFVRNDREQIVQKVSEGDILGDFVKESGYRFYPI
jgi:hypothetical protein